MSLITNLIRRLSLKSGHDLAGADFEHDIPRYPPFARGLPVATAKQIIDTQSDLIADIKIAMGMPGEKFDALVMPVIARFAEYSHLLPASEAHHHRGAGGLFRHSLEVGFYSLRASEAVLFTRQAHPSEIKALEPRWRMAAFIGGLFHDAGKPISDVTVVTPDGQHEWNTFTDSTIYDWATRLKVERYHLRWTANRHGRHERHTPHALYQLMTEDMKGYLQGAGKEVPEALMDALTGLSVSTPLSKLIIQADSNSVEKDLREQHIGHVDQHAVGVAAERYIVSAMRTLVSEGEWKANTAGAVLWVGEDGIYINWRPATKHIVERLAKDKIPGIPQSPDSMAEILLSRDLAEGQAVKGDTGATETLPYWHVKIGGIDLGRGTGSIDFLALKVPADILYSAVQPPPSWDAISLVRPSESAIENRAPEDAEPVSLTKAAADAVKSLKKKSASTLDTDNADDTRRSDEDTANDKGARPQQEATDETLTPLIDDDIEPADDESDVALDDIEIDDLPADDDVADDTPSVSGLFSGFGGDNADSSGDTVESTEPSVTLNDDEVLEVSADDEVLEVSTDAQEDSKDISPSHTDDEETIPAPADREKKAVTSIAANARPASQSLSSRLLKSNAAVVRNTQNKTASPLSAKRELTSSAKTADTAPAQPRRQSLGRVRSLASTTQKQHQEDALVDLLLDGLEDNSRPLGERIDVTHGDNVHIVLSALAGALDTSEDDAMKALLKARLIQPGTKTKARIVLKGKAAKALLIKLRKTPAYKARQQENAHHQRPIRSTANPLKAHAATDAQDDEPCDTKDEGTPWWRDRNVTEQSGRRQSDDSDSDSQANRADDETSAGSGVRDEADALAQLAAQMRAGKGRWLTTTLTRDKGSVSVSDIVLNNIRSENPICTPTKLKAAIRRQGEHIGMSRQAKSIRVTTDCADSKAQADFDKGERDEQS